jgi:hypothetical protein
MTLVKEPLEALVDMYDLRDGHLDDAPFVPAANRSYLPPGWYPITRRLVEDLVRLGWDRKLLQVKEKMGTLRFYIRPRTEALGERIDAATDESAIVCDQCGQPAVLREETHWWLTRCDACR